MRTFFFNLVLMLNLWALELPHCFHASFIQKIYSDSKSLTYKGEIFTDSKNVFWKYTYPEKKYIWVNNKVYVYEPDLMQVTISKKPKFNLFEAVKEAKKINKDEYVAILDNKKVHFIYNGELKKAWYTDDAGNRVEITFLNQSTKPLEKKIFTPDFPKDTDIIQEY